MTKRRKHEEIAVEVPAADDEPTRPGIVEDPIFADDEDGDTQVNLAPPAVDHGDEWEAHTPAIAEPEIAELAAASIDADSEAVPLGDAGAPAEAGVDDAAPPVEAPGRLANIIESLLFASDRPLTLSDLKRLVGERDGSKLTAALEDLSARRLESGIHVIQVAGGWQLRTNPENVPWVSRLLSGKPVRLSRAMLEALAIIAYRQPITRPEIDEIRGVDCGPVLKTLLDRSLVRMIGKKEEVGRPILYGTTPEFLRMFSLRDLSELPTLREFHELGAAEMAKVDAATPPGAEAPPQSGAVRPQAAAIREPDPEEEDRLLADLESAATAATRAAAPRAEEAPAEAAAPDGSAAPDQSAHAGLGSSAAGASAAAAASERAAPEGTAD
jgi:segregation and condensation protein B